MHVQDQTLGPVGYFHNYMYIEVSRSELSPSLVEVVLKRIATGGDNRMYREQMILQEEVPNSLKSVRSTKKGHKSGRGDDLTVSPNWATLYLGSQWPVVS